MKTILNQLQYKDLAEDYRSHIESWVKLWQGEIKGFHEYREFNGREQVNRYRKTLGMGKKGCEDWADTLFNPETQITVDEAKQARLNEILEDNDFENKFNVLLEKTFAFGTGAIVENQDEKGNIKIDFVDARNIYPLKVEYGTITECAFASQHDHKTTVLQVHKKEGSKYKIENHVFEKQGKTYQKKELPKHIKPTFTSDYALFQIIKPALANNVDIDQPMGLSVLANAVDETKGVDQAYTSLDAELRTGRIRAFVQVGGLDKGITEDGEEYLKYDKDQEEYYILPEDTINEEGTFIKVDAPTLRVDSIELALEKQLTLFGRKIGFGDDAYSFRDGSVYTNTAQIISTNSKFFKTRQKHLTVVEKAVKSMVEAIMLIDGSEVKEVTVDFDDSIIEDTEVTFNHSMMLLNAGHISIQEFFERTENLTPELAQELVDKINDDKGLQEEVALEGEDQVQEKPEAKNPFKPKKEKPKVDKGVGVSE